MDLEGKRGMGVSVKSMGFIMRYLERCFFKKFVYEDLSLLVRGVEQLSGK